MTVAAGGAAPFFIVGSARSGTTMLRLMLNAHVDVSVPPESRFVVELYEQDEVDVKATLARLGAHHRWAAWELPLELVQAELKSRIATYEEVMSAAYRAYAKAQGKTRWGDKTPRYVEDIPLLARVFPSARFVHLVRDGRNVALSYADVPFGPKTVARAAALWARRVQAGVSTGRALSSGRYLEMRYESLTEPGRTKSEVERLCSFLSLRFDARMLDFAEESKSAILDRAQHYNPHLGKGTQAQVRQWETSMPAAQIEMFEAVAGRALDTLEYARRYPAPSLRARAGAALARAGLPIGRLGTTRE